MCPDFNRPQSPISGILFMHSCQRAYLHLICRSSSVMAQAADYTGMSVQQSGLGRGVRLLMVVRYSVKNTDKINRPSGDQKAVS